jgi:hypothetical protein
MGKGATIWDGCMKMARGFSKITEKQRNSTPKLAKWEREWDAAIWE